jgi:hypothetical protein
MPERVVVISFNSHDTNFSSRHFLKYQNALWPFKSSHNAKLLVAVSLKPQRVQVVFSLTESFGL